MNKFLLLAMLAFGVGHAAPALAGEPTPASPLEAGKAEEHKADYTADDDGDGVANWRDATDNKTGEKTPDYVAGNLASQGFDLALLFGVLFFALRRPVSDALRDRAHDVRKEITDAARLRDEARHRHDEINARLASVEDVVKNLRDTAEAEARAEEKRLVARAEHEAQRIAELTERNVREEVVRARVALRKEAVDLAVLLAENALNEQVQPEDQRRLAQQFLDSLALTPTGADHG